ncbi:MAG: 30S ribosomal protein S5 [Flavobacteriaceae bacterium]|nr:30S ribosomal protein S5 [Flavobacteriaceae bacterium]
MPKLKKKLSPEDEKEQDVLQKVEEEEEKEIKEENKKVSEPKTRESREEKKRNEGIEAWKPKTQIGKDVKEGKITNIDDILDNGLKILESEIVDILLPDVTVDLLLVGQSKGKFGGGQRRIFRQTQKKTKEGNKPKFATFAVAGNGNGYIGIGYGKSKETVPAREKAIRASKLNIMKIKRGCGSWECGCGEPHTLPFTIEGKCGSVNIKIFPAPKGTGLKVEHECAKILKLAGVTDAWSKTFGKTSTKLNLIKASIAALRQLVEMKIGEDTSKRLGIIEGALVQEKKVDEEFLEEIKGEEGRENE